MHDEESVESLNKQLFNIKLKCYYLEESLAKAKAGSSDMSTALAAENLQMRLELDEKSQELDDKNMLLVKARNAIESLQGDLELQRAEMENSLRERTQSSSQQLRERDDMLSESAARINVLSMADAARRDELHALAATIQRLQSDLAAKAREETRWQKIAEESQAEVVKLRRDLVSAREQCAGQQAAVDVESRRVAELLASIAAKESEISRLETVNSDLERARKQAATRIERELSDAAERQAAMLAESERLAAALAHVAELQEQLDGLTNTVYVEGAAKSKQRQELVAAQQTAVELQRRCTDQEARLKEAAQREADLQGALKQLEQEKARGEAAAREAATRRDIEHARSDAVTRRSFHDREELLRGDLARLQEKITNAEFARAAAESELARRESLASERIAELSAELRTMALSQSTLFKSHLPRAEIDAAVLAMQAKCDGDMVALREEHARAMAEALQRETVKLNHETDLRRSFEGEVVACRNRVATVVRECADKISKWEAAVSLQLGPWVLSDSSLAGLPADAAGVADSPGGTLMLKLVRLRNVKAAFEEAVRAAEARQTALIQRLTSHVNSREAELKTAEKRIERLAQELQQLHASFGEKLKHQRAAIETERGDKESVRESYGAAIAESERHIKQLDSANAALEGELEATEKLAARLRGDLSLLQARAEAMESAAAEASLARDEAMRRADRLAESNRLLMLELDDCRDKCEAAQRQLWGAESASLEAEGLRKAVADGQAMLLRLSGELEGALDMLAQERASRTEMQNLLDAHVEDFKASMNSHTRLAAGDDGLAKERSDLFRELVEHENTMVSHRVQIEQHLKTFRDIVSALTGVVTGRGNVKGLEGEVIKCQTSLNYQLKKVAQYQKTIAAFFSRFKALEDRLRGTEGPGLDMSPTTI